MPGWVCGEPGESQRRAGGWQEDELALFLYRYFLLEHYVLGGATVVEVTAAESEAADGSEPRTRARLDDDVK